MYFSTRVDDLKAEMKKLKSEMKKLKEGLRFAEVDIPYHYL